MYKHARGSRSRKSSDTIPRELRAQLFLRTYQRGKNAWLSNKREYHNPYDKLSTLGQIWLKGYTDIANLAK